MNDQKTIFLVDDDDAVRNALGLFLEHQQFAVNSYSSAEALLETISHEDSGVLVLDISMQGMSGLELQTQLNARGILLPIVFITGHGNIRDSVSAMKQGAVDFIEKPFDNETLLTSIRQAQKRAIETNAQRFLVSALSKRYQTLTPREQEVMQHVVEGASNKQLAAQLGVSNRTIEVHRSRVMTKMEATSLPDLVRMSLLLFAEDS